MDYQLRDYDVRPGAMDDWLREWMDTIVPLRRRLGFEVVGAWTIGSERFVWILGHASFADANNAYYELPERKALSPDPARHLSRVDAFMMRTAL